MERTLAKDTVKKIGEKARLAGWVDTKRDHGKITFIDLRDRSGMVQIVGSGSEFSSLSPESVVEVVGVVKRRPDNLVNPKLETGKVEIGAEKITLLSKAHELPIDMGGEDLNVSLPTLLDNRSLTMRHPKQKNRK